MKRHILLAVLLLCASFAQAADPYVLKFATLAPVGTSWMNILQDWAKQVNRDSGGRLIIKLYPGGVSGDEPDVLRKIRFGQLQGGAFTGHGIGLIYPAARILEMPFLYRDVHEIDYVRQQMMPEFEAGFRRNKYELVGWMEFGFLRFFSREPLHTIDDLKKRRVWMWQGDALAQSFFDATHVEPVPLSIADVYTSLSTGLIDTVPSPPLAAIAMQWFTKTSYVTNFPIMDAMGALLIDAKFFAQLPPDLQKLLKTSGAAIGDRLLNETRKDNDKSIEVLKQNGLKFTMNAGDVKESELFDMRDRAAATLAKSGYIPQSVFDRARKLLEDYRARTTSTQAKPR
ncbi:MAG: TRAP transporter substrate-binding protein [Gammaproteobacteria bacterium]